VGASDRNRIFSLAPEVISCIQGASRIDGATYCDVFGAKPLMHLNFRPGIPVHHVDGLQKRMPATLTVIIEM